MKIPDLTAATNLPRDGRTGIIDIGSNSLRLVVYDQQKRSPVAIYNEKVMCALGKGLASSGVLNPEGVPLARDALRRFLAMSRNMEVNSLHIMATAAVRDAKDGKSFAKLMEETYDIDIDIISGKKEAKLGAYGVCASMYKPEGITGDLGGGSLELVKLEDGQIFDHTSLLLGSLRMIDEAKGNRDRLRKLVEKRFSDQKWIDKTVPNFYAVGGSFRALAKIHMAAHNYPLRILHEYKADAKEFLSFAQNIAAMSDAKLEKLPGASSKRVPALPGAAMVLEHIINHANPQTIVFSTSGIREGYLYEMLPPQIRAQDGLLTSCTEFAARTGRSTAYANEMFTWMYPLLEKESNTDRRLRLAFCLLSDYALHIHPEYRAEWAFNRMLFSALTGFTHRERVKLGLALYHRYQFKLRGDWPAMALLNEKDCTWAKLVGTCANLAYYLSGCHAGNLNNTSFVIEKNKLSLQLAANMQDILGEAVRKRMDNVRIAYGEYGK